jgi:acetyl-CoA synthetase
MNIELEKLPDTVHESVSNILDSENSVDQKWRDLTGILSPDQCGVDTYREIWNNLQSQWTTHPECPMPMWFPVDNIVEGANVTPWMRELGHTDFRQFHQWTIDHREAFWQQMIQRLQIRFHTACETLLENGDNPAAAKWLVGARMNIVDSCFLADPDAIAVKVQRPGQPMRHLTYAQLESLTNCVANGFINAGFKPGDAIGVVLPMTDISVALYLGIVRAGLVVVSIADSFAAPQIENRLAIAKAKAVVTYDQMTRSGKAIPLYSRVCQSTALPIIVIAEDNGQREVQIRKQDISWTAFVDSNDQFKSHVSDSSDPINILFSSGTTGDPKAIPWTHQTPIKCAADGFIHQDIHAGHVVAWPTNLGWMMGPWLIFAALINRACIALYEDAPLGVEFGRFVEQARVNMLGVVPTIVKHWRASACMEPFDWSNIHVFSSTGESSHPEDMFYLSSLAGMKPVVEYCGGTEIGGAYITSTVVEPNVASAFSTPAVGLNVCILDENNQPADAGEMFLVPPSIGLSDRLLNRDHNKTYYKGLPKCDGQALRKHGDQFRRLTNGYYVAGGRIDDTMNLGGIKVSSSEIERVLNRIEGIKETAAIAVSENGGPDQLVVYVVWETESPADENELIAEMNRRLKSELNPLFRVWQIRNIELLPRTASNKVMRRKLREAYESGRSQAK